MDPMKARGSRKHVLDWTSRSSFADELRSLVRPIEIAVFAGHSWMPRGHESPEEARLETFGPSVMDTPAWAALRSWWLAHEQGANTPNWDVAVHCEIEGRSGLVLIEAKANVPELAKSGKQLAPNASPASIANHHQIGRAIDEACTALRRFSAEVAIGRDSHYQFANRVAFAWKLATLGIPTILVYLGFTGDTGIIDAGEPFRDDMHWRQEFSAHVAGVAPDALFERRLACGAAPTWVLVRSRTILKPSPPQTRRRQLRGEAR